MSTMKAALFTHYGPPDVVEIRDVETPQPGDDEVRIAVRAASVNALDWRSVTGTPFAARLGLGLRRPKDSRLGVDAAGVVDAVGRNVTGFKPGDAVFGTARGAFAEFACTPASALAMKPENVTFEQAACLPIAAFTALQGLRKGGAAAGSRVLVNGAAGGVGSFAVQIAHALGAHVTGVTGPETIDLVRSIGADDVMDYSREDFTRGDRRYDLILDCHATHPLLACRRALNPGGSYVAVGGPFTGVTDPLGLVLKCLVLSWFGRRKLGLLMARRNREDLVALSDLMQQGKITPVIDRRFALSEAREAIAYVAAGRARGKVVVGTA